MACCNAPYDAARHSIGRLKLPALFFVASWKISSVFLDVRDQGSYIQPVFVQFLCPIITPIGIFRYKQSLEMLPC